MKMNKKAKRENANIMNVGQIYYPSNSDALRGLLIVVSKPGEWVCHFDIGQSEC